MFELIILFIGVAILFYNSIHKRLISSSSLWVFCYLMIFVIYPLLTNRVYTNSELISECAIMGIICFAFGELCASKISFFKSINKYPFEALCPKFSYAFTLYWIIFVLYISTFIMAVGANGILAVLFGSITSKQLALDDSLSVSNLYTFVFQLFVPCIIGMWISAKTKKEQIKKYFCFLLYASITMLFGFTRMFFICLLAIIFFYQVRNYSLKKQVYFVSLAVVALILLMIIMNFVRNLGLGNWSDLIDRMNIDFLFESTDFSFSYHYLNELLNFESPYISPLVYLKAFFFFIPRELWEAKPESLSLQVLRYIDPFLANTGFSTGCSVLGEGYAILGYPGMALITFLWGIVCTRLDVIYYRYLMNNKEKSLYFAYYYIFTTFILINGQRGDWSIYLLMILWLYMLPLYIISKFKM